MHPQLPGTRLAAVLITVATALLSLTGCGGGSTSGNPLPADADGTVLIALTDADGDFLRYAVDIVSLSLEKANGSRVETLPATGRLDFAGYQELTELFTATQVPAGTYVAGSITLDYANADLQVEADGAPVPAIAVGRDGKALARYTLRIQLASDRPLIVRAGVPAMLSIDFDLDASHEVDITRNPPIVTAAPFLVAELEPVAEKDLRVRGSLEAVDTEASAYTIQLRPWHLRPGIPFGSTTVYTANNTEFEIDGASYTGAAGLTALAVLPADTPTVAFGTFTTADRRYEASVVLAGSSVPGQGLDAVLGSVTARVGDILTVRGATLLSTSGMISYRDTVTVLVGDNTSVRRRPGLDLDASAISVGQRVEVLGTIDSRPAMPATVLDATSGRVRLLVTHIAGIVSSSSPGQLNIGLAKIERRPPDIFDFSGTGTSPVVDADPADYEVATSSLPLNGITTGDAVQLFGFVQPFGAAPQDFNALTVVDLRARGARLALDWWPAGTTAPFLVLDPGGLVPDLDNPSLGKRHAVVIGGVPIDLLSLPAAPTLVPPATGRTRYAILQDRSVTLYPDFASLTTALGERLNGSTRTLGLWADGAWDGDRNEFIARILGVHLSTD
ncbi:MAG: hypothetical protein OEV14_04430 [Gammaproteobacteria bacterium]|nr:hypothetical protein [Gammaproteobacteria bacterium]